MPRMGLVPGDGMRYTESKMNERLSGMRENLAEALKAAPIIAAVRDEGQLLRAARSPVRVVFLLGGDLFTLPEMVSRARAAGKISFVHMDLVEGLSRDGAGVKWIARRIRPDGVLSTRAPLLKTAAAEGLGTVLRIFMVDSSSLETGERMVKGARPDLVEVMPGLAVRAVGELGARIDAPVIAGGMLETARDVQLAWEAGALAASTSREALWKLGGLPAGEGRQHGYDGR